MSFYRFLKGGFCKEAKTTLLFANGGRGRVHTRRWEYARCGTLLFYWSRIRREQAPALRVCGDFKRGAPDLCRGRRLDVPRWRFVIGRGLRLPSLCARQVCCASIADSPSGQPLRGNCLKMGTPYFGEGGAFKRDVTDKAASPKTTFYIFFAFSRKIFLFPLQFLKKFAIIYNGKKFGR